MRMLWFALGVAAGSAVGMLTAPHSGDETREMLSNKFEDGKRFVEESTQGLRDLAAEAVEEGKQMIERQTGTIRDALEVGRQAYQIDLQSRRERVG